MKIQIRACISGRLTGILIISGCDNCLYPATDIKVAFNLTADRGTGSHQVIQNFVGHMFMKNTLVPDKKTSRASMI